MLEIYNNGNSKRDKQFSKSKIQLGLLAKIYRNFYIESFSERIRQTFIY